LAMVRGYFLLISLPYSSAYYDIVKVVICEKNAYGLFW